MIRIGLQIRREACLRTVEPEFLMQIGFDVGDGIFEIAVAGRENEPVVDILSSEFDN
jgi:hypothetical protein